MVFAIYNSRQIGKFKFKFGARQAHRPAPFMLTQMRPGPPVSNYGHAFMPTPHATCRRLAATAAHGGHRPIGPRRRLHTIAPSRRL
jgi:hypothetical protein